MAGGDRHRSDDTLVALLAFGHRVEYAAQQAGVSERTAHRRLDDPTFRARVDGLRAQALERASAALLTAAAGAVRTLVDLSTSAKSEHVRQQAARSILEMTTALYAEVQMERRITALESNLPTSIQAMQRRIA